MTRYVALAFLVAAASFSMLAPADAREGCGLGRHRGPLGACHDNVAPVVVAPRAAVVATPNGEVVVAPRGKVCPIGWHLGPLGHCRRN